MPVNKSNVKYYAVALRMNPSERILQKDIQHQVRLGRNIRLQQYHVPYTMQRFLAAGLHCTFLTRPTNRAGLDVDQRGALAVAPMGCHVVGIIQ